MSLPIHFSRPAQRELDHAVDWYEDRRSGLGDRFNNRVVELITQIVSNPQLFAEVEDGVREAHVRRFPYCVYFRVLADRIEIISVFHTSRDPETWRSRI
jgi:plasmid stabilization system protein ParE